MARPKYVIHTEMMRIADACHDLADYAKGKGKLDTALDCLKEARTVAALAVQVEQHMLTVGAAQNALIQVESARRIADARLRRGIPSAPTTILLGGRAQEAACMQHGTETSDA